MARNTKIGNLYFGVGFDHRGGKRDLDKQSKNNKSFVNDSKRQFNQLSKDLSNIPFFGKYLDRLKGVTDGIKAMMSASKTSAALGAGFASGKKTGSTKSTGSLGRSTIAGLQLGEIAREAKADEADRILQEKQNKALDNNHEAQLKFQQIQQKYHDQIINLTADIKSTNEDQAGFQREAAQWQKKFGKQTQRDKEISKTEKEIEKAVKAQAIATERLSMVMQRQEKRKKDHHGDSQISARQFVSIRRGIAERDKEIEAMRNHIDAVENWEETLKGMIGDGESFNDQLKHQEESLKAVNAAMEKEVKQLDDETRLRRKAEQDKIDIQAAEAKANSLLGRSLGMLKSAADTAGSALGKVGADVAVGTGVAARGGEEGSGGSMTGKIMTALGIRALMRTFPALNGYVATFAKWALASKGAFALIGGALIAGVIAGVVAAGIALAKFVSMGRKAAEQFDKLAKQSKLLGVNVNQLNRLRQQGIQLAGMEAKAVDTAIQRFTRRLSDGTLDKKLKEMGFTLAEISNLKMQNSADALDKVRKKFSEIASEGERLRLAFAMFDTEGAKFALALASQGETIDEINAKMERYGLIVTANQQKALMAVKATNEELEMQAEGTSTQVGAASAGVAESWNKLVLEFKEATKIQEIFNWLAVKGMKAFEMAVDAVRVTLVPVFDFVRNTADLMGVLFDQIQKSMVFSTINKYSKSIAQFLKIMRDMNDMLNWPLDPVFDMWESTLEMLGFETQITKELENQEALRQKLAANRAQEIEDMEAKTKAAERELAVLKEGEKAVKVRELSKEYKDTLAAGKMEGESDANFKRRKTEALKLFLAARKEYEKNYDEQMAAEKRLADFKAKRAREIALIEKKHEDELAKIQKDADDKKAAAEKAGSDRQSIVGQLFGSQSFTAGQSFAGGSSEEYSYLRDRKMAEQRRNEEKIARDKMQQTLENIESNLEDQLQLENEAYRDTATDYSNRNSGVELSAFNGIDPS